MAMSKTQDKLLELLKNGVRTVKKCAKELGKHDETIRKALNELKNSNKVYYIEKSNGRAREYSFYITEPEKEKVVEVEKPNYIKN